MPVGLNAEPGADADFPGVLGVSSHDLFGWPVFVGPRVVGWDRCTVVALGACPVAAIEDVESRATPRAAHAYVSLMRISFSPNMFSVETATMCSNVDRQLGSSSQSQPTRTDELASGRYRSFRPLLARGHSLASNQTRASAQIEYLAGAAATRTPKVVVLLHHPRIVGRQTSELNFS